MSKWIVLDSASIPEDNLTGDGAVMLEPQDRRQIPANECSAC